MVLEYIAGYINGYADAQKNVRTPDCPQRHDYNMGYDCGYEDGVYHEVPEYNALSDTGSEK